MSEMMDIVMELNNSQHADGHIIRSSIYLMH